MSLRSNQLKTLVFSLTLAIATTLSWHASAQVMVMQPVMVGTLDPRPPSPNVTRIRWGVGTEGRFTVGGGLLSGAQGVQFTIGSQLNDVVAIAARIGLGSIVVSGYGRAAAVAEFSPHDAVSLGVGLGLEGYYFYLPCLALFGGCSSSSAANATVQLPLNVGFHFGRRGATTARRGFTLGLEFAPGIAVGDRAGGWTFSGSIYLGYDVR